jgi:glycine hydroxymethyltransferase
MADFLVRGSLADIDPAIAELIQLESERQFRKLILIPSESTAPQAVLETLGSRLQNLYAEGYPDEDTRRMTEKEILDYPARLAHFRRYADPRYYKGVEYCDTIESLARRRCAEVFATSEVSADDLYVNVQALSGAPANNAVYQALVKPGDVVMGMNLLHGGHLSHGSSANRSGKWYKIISYAVDPTTEKIDYDAVETLARENKPKMIIAGFSSYPWIADWARFRQIADSVGAYLLADVAHVAGLIAGGVYPSPVGHAHVITFTTHKSLCGPRGACILTTDSALARKIDRAVFPGEQGGPHLNAIGAIAVMFGIVRSPAFRKQQEQVLKNASRLASALQAEGFRLPFGGTNTHLLNVDTKSVRAPDGTPLSGDLAARVLDLAGIVLNRNTIPGDASAAVPTGIRMGTPWITQRGLREKDMDTLAGAIARVLHACHPFRAIGRKGDLLRARIDFDVLEAERNTVRTLAEKAGIDFRPSRHGYPHFYFLESRKSKKGFAQIRVSGGAARQFLYWATTNDTYSLKPGGKQRIRLALPGGDVEGVLASPHDGFILTVPAAKGSLALAWLRGLSDGYIRFDDDLARKIPGPVIVEELVTVDALPRVAGDAVDFTRPYFIPPAPMATALPALAEFSWKDSIESELKRTSLFETHQALGAKLVPFAGWEMPVWYTGVLEEHAAVRDAAGLFDVTHMGVWEAKGSGACAFLDSICANEIAALSPGQSLYTHFLSPDGSVIDDLMVYFRAPECYLIVVNAANDDKDWAWVDAVREGAVQIDNTIPWAKAPGRGTVRMRNLRASTSGADRRVDIALQGPQSRNILLALGCDAATSRRVRALARTELCDANIGGFDLIVSRTGYTGELMSFELFVHPDKSVALWNALLAAGASKGLKPAGLGARDSLRTEAGLPLYGHEFAGTQNYSVGQAGFDSYVKLNKPWFIGRAGFIAQEKNRAGEVTRFRFDRKGVRMAHPGDAVFNIKGARIGTVTSCALDSERFLSGQACLPFDYLAEGTPISISVNSGEGGKTSEPEPATVLSRFYKKPSSI